MVFTCPDSYNNNEYDAYFSLFPFQLSPFQKWAIEGIIKKNHVLVTAHTGSGKTLPAEFAIKHFTAKNKKVIYTSPIKALSNQKFYEFSQKFPDISIGLFTGDIKINPEADVLIMTTEILQNTLFNHIHGVKHDKTMMFQMDFESELAAVVFDEIHYINDEHRGQVWEKCLVMLPEHVQKIMLSATMDNAHGFAKWCENIHKSEKVVYLSTTTTRVVPLTHYSFIAISESLLKSIKNKEIQQDLRKNTNVLIKIQNEKGVFDLQNGYNTVKRIEAHFDAYHAASKRKFVLNKLTAFLKEKNMLPAIGFVFSRKQVEQCAHEITTILLPEDSKIPHLVRKECDHLVRRLPNHAEYLELPEYIELVGLLEKGIGIHHSGMIPILRELVEMCISKKYIQLLFATESFAVGLDCPIKTAIFTGITKFDGSTQRGLLSHEYTQMAGRAGRRGIDTVGYIVHCNNLFRLPDKTTYETMLNGKPPKLTSKFRLSYDLILNILKPKEESEQTVDSILEFTQKSIMYSELEEEINSQRLLVRNVPVWENQVPLDVCEKMFVLCENEERSVNRKKKEIQKQIQEYKIEYGTLDDAMKQYSGFMEKENQHKNTSQYLASLEGFLNKKVQRTSELMEQKGFLVCTENTFRPTLLGEMASRISEIYSLPWMECIVKNWNYFEKFDVKQLVGLFSCTTNIKVKMEFCRHTPNPKDEYVKTAILELIRVHEEYAELENTFDIQIGTNTKELLMFDLIDEAMEWCECDTEKKCKVFLKDVLSEKEISTGDFTKAMMKIANISRELQTVAEQHEFQGQADFSYKLSQVENLVLKYIATNQSLYV
jgi:superfamily II RNA helicase